MGERFVVVAADEAHERGWHDPRCDAEHDAGYEVFDTASSPPTYIGGDAGEPEDKLLVRDYDWVPSILNVLADRLAALERLHREVRAAIGPEGTDDWSEVFDALAALDGGTG